jgi:hypothetical protein
MKLAAAIQDPRERPGRRCRHGQEPDDTSDSGNAQECRGRRWRDAQPEEAREQDHEQGRREAFDRGRGDIPSEPVTIGELRRIARQDVGIIDGEISLVKRAQREEPKQASDAEQRHRSRQRRQNATHGWHGETSH